MAIPTSPKIGQLYYDYPTGTMRRWNGKHWQETTSTEVKNDIKNRKKRLISGKVGGNKKPSR